MIGWLGRRIGDTFRDWIDAWREDPLLLFCVVVGISAEGAIVFAALTGRLT